MAEELVWLYDDLHRMTFEWKKVFGPEHSRHDFAALNALRLRYRQEIRTARRMVIEDGFLGHTLDASGDIDQIKHWINLARLPFPVT